MVDHVDHFRQQRRRRDGEPGILHVRGVGRFLAAKRAEKRKLMFADNGYTSAGAKFLNRDRRKSA